MRGAEKITRPAGSGPGRRSGLVDSSQADIHPRLQEIVQRHLRSAWAQPLHRPSVAAYQQLPEQSGLSARRPWILDSGCGTGKSTRTLAAMFPHHLVLGIDRSRHRLGRSGVANGFLSEGNCLLLRAELTTAWRLLVADGYTPERHFLLYPNPWPKPGHLQRRWHGHPVFPHLLALGGSIEMRCNWAIYAQEFARAVSIATGGSVSAHRYRPATGLSPFEQKYLERGQSLYAVTVPRELTAAFRDGHPAV